MGICRCLNMCISNDRKIFFYKFVSWWNAYDISMYFFLILKYSCCSPDLTTNFEFHFQQIFQNESCLFFLAKQSDCRPVICHKNSLKNKLEIRCRIWWTACLILVFSLWWFMIYKVHIFWEGHKILRNLHLTFDWQYIGQK